jgi:hypothetical protein
MVLLAAAPEFNHFPSSDRVYKVACFDELNHFGPTSFQEVGTYHGLQFKGFDLVPGRPRPNTAGKRPAHEDKVAAYGRNEQYSTGQPTVTVDYAESSWKTFDLESFHFCGISDDSTAFDCEPKECTIVVTGYGANNKKIGLKVFTFVPGSSCMAMASLGFRGLTSVRFSTTFPPGSKKVATFLDSLAYTLHK